MQSSAADPTDLANMVAAGALDPAARVWLQHGFAAWLRAGCALPLERCLRLPNTPRRVQLAKRNYWLIEAARSLDASSSWGASVAVAEEMDSFLSRGPWRAWKDLERPPEGASQLRTALFHAVKANGGESLTARHVSRCIGHIFDVKCR